jgi:hypothetical protein
MIYRITMYQSSDHAAVATGLIPPFSQFSVYLDKLTLAQQVQLRHAGSLYLWRPIVWDGVWWALAGPGSMLIAIGLWLHLPLLVAAAVIPLLWALDVMIIEQRHHGWLRFVLSMAIIHLGALIALQPVYAAIDSRKAWQLGYFANGFGLFAIVIVSLIFFVNEVVVPIWWERQFPRGLSDEDTAG